MEIILRHTLRKGEIIEGEILIDGTHVCDTLENYYNGLPEGRYKIQIEKCTYRSRQMPLIIATGTDKEPSYTCDQCTKPYYVSSNSSPHRGGEKGEPVYCPMVTPGNGIHNRFDGSILVGKRGALGLLLHSRPTFDSLYQRIRKSIQRGKSVTLIIKKNWTHP